MGAVFVLFSSLLMAKEKTYTVPAPPDMLRQRIELIEPKGTVSLTEATALALLHNPTLQGYAWAVRIADVNTLQASLVPNPELTIEAENFFASEQQGEDVTEITASISQVFELGGKSKKRESLANAERDVVLWDYQSQRSTVIYAVAKHYIDVLANQAHLKLSTKMLTVAEKLYKTVVNRVDAGLVSPLEQSKSRVDLANVRLNQVKAQREQLSYKQNLSAVWGSVNPQFETVSGDLFALQSVPAFSVMLDRLGNNPDLARGIMDITRYRQAIKLAQSQKIPDITVMAGARHFAEDDGYAAIAGISVPLFVFDTQQTGVDKAQIMLAQAVQTQRAKKITLQSALVESYQQLKMSQVEIKAFKDEVIPSALDAFKAVQLAYQLGEVGAMALLDAQRILFKSEQQYLDAATAFRQSVIKIERLIGGTLYLSPEKVAGKQ